MPVDLDEFPEHLASIRQRDWQRLFDLGEQIEPGGTYGELRGGEKLEDGSFNFPYWQWSEIVVEFHNLLYDLELVINFDWPNWKEGEELLTNGNQEFDHLDVITLCKLLTMIVRADRFNDGLMIRYFEDGTILNIIQALKINIEEE